MTICEAGWCILPATRFYLDQESGCPWAFCEKCHPNSHVDLTEISEDEHTVTLIEDLL